MFKKLPLNIPGIPRAPGLIFRHSATKHFEDEKERLRNRIPVLNAEKLISYRSPYIVLFQKLLSLGFQHVVDEILELKELETLEVQHCRRSRPILLRDMNLLGKISGVLKICRKLEVHGKYLKAASGRYRLAEDLLQDGDLFLGRHFVMTALSMAERDHTEAGAEFQAKMHCLLAYMAKQYYSKLEDRMANTVDHLETALMLSKNTSWIYRTKYISVPLRTPISIYGLRQEFKEEWSANYPVYKQCMLIYYELLMTLSDPKGPIHHSPEEFAVAYQLAEEALHMAKETRNATAKMSALMRCGMLMRRVGRFLTAKSCFDQLLSEAEFAKDLEAQALAYANIGHCYQGKKQPEEAMNWFHLENELATENDFQELMADSFEHMGYIMLQEGILTEAELSLAESYTLYKKSVLPQEKQQNLFSHEAPKHKSLTDSTWAFSAVASGINLWGRFSGLCRQLKEYDDDLETILEWKDHRTNLDRVSRPLYDPYQVNEVIEELDERRIPVPEECDVACIKNKASAMLNVAAVDQSGIFLPSKSRKSVAPDWRCPVVGEYDHLEPMNLTDKLLKKVRYISDGPNAEEDEDEDEEQRRRNSMRRSIYGSNVFTVSRKASSRRQSRVLSFARGSTQQKDIVVDGSGNVLGYRPSSSHAMLRTSSTEIGEIKSTMFDVRPSRKMSDLRDYNDHVPEKRSEAEVHQAREEEG